MLEQLNQQLQYLVGLPLTETTRASDMECLKFGVCYRTDKHGTYNIGEFGLHLQCPWRIVNQSEIIVGSHDLFEQPNEQAEYDESFAWDEPFANLRDVKLKEIISHTQHLVKFALADKLGGIAIEFNTGIALTAFPTVSSKADNEYWRLLDNRSPNKNHWVSTSNGYYL